MRVTFACSIPMPSEFGQLSDETREMIEHEISRRAEEVFVPKWIAEADRRMLEGRCREAIGLIGGCDE